MKTLIDSPRILEGGFHHWERATAGYGDPDYVYSVDETDTCINNSADGCGFADGADYGFGSAVGSGFENNDGTS